MIKVSVNRDSNVLQFVVINTDNGIIIKYPWFVFALNEQAYKYKSEFEQTFRNFFYPAAPFDPVVRIECDDDAKKLIDHICEINRIRS